MNHKKIDVNSETPVEIKTTKKVGLISEITSIQKDIVVQSKKTNTSFMIFAFQKIQEKYGIDYDTILMLTYLSELSLFSIRLKIQSRGVYLLNYIDLGLIQKDYSVKNRSVYRLTPKSEKIVSEFVELVDNPDDVLEKNREVDLDVDTKVSSVLSKYFSR